LPDNPIRGTGSRCWTHFSAGPRRTHRLQRTGGTAGIGEILTEIGWSRARLARRFRTQVGLTPKVAARVIRFGRAAALLRTSASQPLAAIALSCGYSDQAHFTREFREFAGRPPSAWAADLG
jgi:AraC-like DNA-binding protein